MHINQYVNPLFWCEVMRSEGGVIPNIRVIKVLIFNNINSLAHYIIS